MKKVIILIVALFIASPVIFAQKAKNDTTHHATFKYSCPMHTEIGSNKPGKCSKCGMDLMLSKKEQVKAEVTDTYTCLMHPDIVSDTAGKCPKCGMDLTLSKKEQTKTEAMKTYTCPMHPNESSDKPGKCPKCGMALKEKTQQ